MSPAVHQFISSLSPHDALGAHTLAVRDLLRDLGYASEIYVKEARGALRRTSRPYRTFEGGDRDPTVLVYQASTGSAVASFLAERDEPLVVNYHNITPSRFFAPWEPHIGVELDVGRRQVRDLAGRAALGIAVSEFNRGELETMGYRDTVVAPVLVDFTVGDGSHRASTPRERSGADLLFVGRFSPNKAQHDLVKAFAVYRRLYDPEARLHLVGTSSSWHYWQAVNAFVERLGLGDAVDMPGSVSDEALADYYRSADAFVCLSEHEGFCIPLLEAMQYDVPVVAYAAAAVPETLGDAGLVLPEKGPLEIAAAVHRVVTDASLRRRLHRAAERRLAHFSIDSRRHRFAGVITDLVDALA